MKILVTGGAGYIGSVVTEKILQKNHSVFIFDNLSTGNKKLINKKAVFIKGDLLNGDEIRRVFQKNDIDAVFHFAAFSQAGESVKNPQKYYINNVIGTLNLLNAMRDFNVRKIIFSGSAAIFGQPKKIPIDECAEKNPTNPYGASKLVIEDILDQYDESFGIKFVSLRYFNAAGAVEKFGEIHDPETHLIPLILKAAKLKKTVEIFGTDYDTLDGSCVRDYIHVDDLAEAHLLALQFLVKRKKSEKFNLGSEKGFSVIEIIDKCKKITKIDIKTKNSGRRLGDPAILVASSKKIKSILGWKRKKNIDDMIRDAWNWERKQN